MLLVIHCELCLLPLHSMAKLNKKKRPLLCCSQRAQYVCMYANTISNQIERKIWIEVTKKECFEKSMPKGMRMNTAFDCLEPTQIFANWGRWKSCMAPLKSMFKCHFHSNRRYSMHFAPFQNQHKETIYFFVDRIFRIVLLEINVVICQASGCQIGTLT